MTLLSFPNIPATRIMWISPDVWFTTIKAEEVINFGKYKGRLVTEILKFGSGLLFLDHEWRFPVEYEENVDRDPFERL